MRRLLAVALVATGVAPVAAVAASPPVRGSIFGPVTAVKGSAFVLSSTLSPTGRATVSVRGSTIVTEQATASRSSLRVGTCVAAFGTRDAKGVVAASRITLSSPVAGRCTGAFGGRRPGTRPPGSRPRTPPPGGFSRPADLGFAVGGVQAVKGDALTVTGTRGGAKVTTTVTVSAATQLVHTVRVPASAISTGDCAFVDGTSADRGVTVVADRVGLSAKVNGACAGGRFGRSP